MEYERYDYLADMPAKAVDKLAELLRLPSELTTEQVEKWLAESKTKIDGMPKMFRRPGGRNLIGRLAVKLSEYEDLGPVVGPVLGPFVPPAAVLCTSHAKLDPFMIRQLFLLLAEEVTTRTDRFRTFKGDKELPLHPDVALFVERQNAMSTLWMDAELVAQLFDAPPAGGYSRVESGCEACVLSVVGGRGEMLRDLRSNLLARRRRLRPRLLRFVDRWIEMHDARARIVLDSDVLAVKLKEIRRETAHRARERRQKRKEEGREDKKSKVRVPVYTEKGIPLPKKTKACAPTAAEDAALREALDELLDGPFYTPFDDSNRVNNTWKPEIALENPRGDNNNNNGNDNYDEEEDEEDGEDEGEGEGEGGGEHDYSMAYAQECLATQWYAASVANLANKDETSSLLSERLHPAFRPQSNFTVKSAVPAPLSLKKQRGDPSSDPFSTSPDSSSASNSDNTNAMFPPPSPRGAQWGGGSDVYGGVLDEYDVGGSDDDSRSWGDATVLTFADDAPVPAARDAPPVPSLPSIYATFNSKPLPRSRVKRGGYAPSSVYSQDGPGMPHPPRPRSPTPTSTPTRTPPAPRKNNKYSFVESSQVSSSHLLSPPPPDSPLDFPRFTRPHFHGDQAGAECRDPMCNECRPMSPLTGAVGGGDDEQRLLSPAGDRLSRQFRDMQVRLADGPPRSERTVQRKAGGMFRKIRKDLSEGF